MAFIPKLPHLSSKAGVPKLGQSIGFNTRQGTAFVAFTGTEEVIERLNSVIQDFGRGQHTRAGMQEALQIIRRTAIPLTPIDTGNLRNSMYTLVMDGPNGVVGVVGYAAFYAVYVHEIQKNYVAPGTQWKFLSTALAVASLDIIDALVRNIRA